MINKSFWIADSKSRENLNSVFKIKKKKAYGVELTGLRERTWARPTVIREFEEGISIVLEVYLILLKISNAGKYVVVTGILI